MYSGHLRLTWNFYLSRVNLRYIWVPATRYSTSSKSKQRNNTILLFLLHLSLRDHNLCSHWEKGMLSRTPKTCIWKTSYKYWKPPFCYAIYVFPDGVKWVYGSWPEVDLTTLWAWQYNGSLLDKENNYQWSNKLPCCLNFSTWIPSAMAQEP